MRLGLLCDDEIIESVIIAILSRRCICDDNLNIIGHDYLSYKYAVSMRTGHEMIKIEYGNNTFRIMNWFS